MASASTTENLLLRPTTPPRANVSNATPSPPVEAIEIDELDIVDSDFCWSSASSSASSIDESPTISISVPSAGFPAAEKANSIGTQTENAEVTIRRHSAYFWDCIKLQVEGVSFQLPKYRFVEGSDEFMGLVAGSAGHDDRIQLDVTLSDFESFLKAFLPRASAMYDERPSLNKEEWIAVLKLSTQWLFNDLRKLAISHLSSIAMDGIEWICLAKEYRVYDWLLKGYEQVVDRLVNLDPRVQGSLGALTLQEGQKIGMEVALDLSGIVIRRLRGSALESLMRTVKSDVLDTFKTEFEVVKEEGRRFMTRAERKEEVELRTRLGKAKRVKRAKIKAQNDAESAERIERLKPEDLEEKRVSDAQSKKQNDEGRIRDKVTSDGKGVGQQDIKQMRQKVEEEEKLRKAHEEEKARVENRQEAIRKIWGFID